MADADVLKIVGEAHLAKLELGPRDILVVRVDRTISSEISDRIHASIKPHLPAGSRVLVIDSAIELSMLSAAELQKMAR